MAADQSPALPKNPDLERFRRDARRLQRALVAGEQQALDLHTRLHPAGADAPVTLTAAQLTIARFVGFASWPRLRSFLIETRDLRRDPAAEADGSASPADRFLALACLTYSDLDHPDRRTQAVELLRGEPDLVTRSLSVAAAVGDIEAVLGHLATDPSGALTLAGPHRWPPLLYLTYSRVPQADALGTARVLLDAGADPDAGFLWQGFTPPFTALTGCFGEGEGGPARQPRHPDGERLALLLLERGAAVNDAQTLYNRMFGRDDSHLRLLFDHGLGDGDLGAWQTRLGDGTESVAQMMRRQLDWAADHGQTDRLTLLAEHGFHPRSSSAGAAPDVHRAGTPEGVRAAVAAGADVNALEQGRTALHQAAWIGDEQLVTALLDAGADPTIRDLTHDGTPLDWAGHGLQPGTAALLRERVGRVEDSAG